MNGWDILRYCAIIAGMANIGAFSAIVRLNYGYEKRIKGWANLLPSHIRLVSISAMGFVLATIFISIERLHKPPIWYITPFLTIPNLVLFLGLVQLIRYQRAREAYGVRDGDRPSADRRGLGR